MAVVQFRPQPGVIKDETEIEANNRRWQAIDADKVRFRRGFAETIGGWADTSHDVTGKCRGIHVWSCQNENIWAAFGTHRRLHILRGGVLYDATPMRANTVLGSTAISVTSGSPTATITWTAHGLTTGDEVRFFDDVTVAGQTLSGVYSVAVTNANTFTITMAGNANANATAGTVLLIAYVSPGNEDGGATTRARVWSFGNRGEQLLANPSGAGIYRYQPGVQGSPEATTNGDFDTDLSGWTADTNWQWASTPGEGSAYAKADGGATTLDIKQEVSLIAGVTYRLRIRTLSMTGSGSIQAKIDSTDVGTAMASNGTFVTTFTVATTGAYDLSLVASTAASNIGYIAEISLKPVQQAFAVANAPERAEAMFVTTFGHIVALATNTEVSGNAWTPNLIRHSDNDSITTWTSAATNQAGEQPIMDGSRIVGGGIGFEEYLVWTDTALVSMRPSPDPILVHSYRTLGTGCGLIGAKAFAIVNGAAFWMSPKGQFMVYDGQAVRPLNCPLERDVFDNLSDDQQSKIVAWHNAKFDEIWWLYARGSGNEVDAYVAYNFREDHWTEGTLDRTVGYDSPLLALPYMVDSTGNVFEHETGFLPSDTEGTVTFSYQAWANAETLLQIQGFWPDRLASLSDGSTLVEVLTRAYPMSTPSSAQALGTITAASTKLDALITGRFAALRFRKATGAAGGFRLGDCRLDVIDTGMRQ